MLLKSQLMPLHKVSQKLTSQIFWENMTSQLARSLGNMVIIWLRELLFIKRTEITKGVK